MTGPSAGATLHAVPPGNFSEPFAALNPFEDAISLSAISGSKTQLRAINMPNAPLLKVDEPPEYDRAFRLNYLEPGVCLRFDLCAPCIAPALAATLRERHASLLGSDDALYDYERATRSQYKNRNALLGRLIERLRAAGATAN